MITYIKDLLHSVVTTFAMFSRVPTPRLAWKEEHMRYTLANLPLVGAVLGLLLAGWWYLCDLLAFDGILFSAGITLLPVVFTGGIHLDGFCDTVDALASRAEPEKKRAILKDPHIGAFAAIGVCAYLLAYFALGTEFVLGDSSVSLLFLIPVLSRTVTAYVSASAVSVSEGLLDTMRKAARMNYTKWILVLWFVAVVAVMLVLSPLAGAALVLSAVLCGWFVRRQALRQFGGMNGDLAGYLLQVCELAMLFALILMQRVLWIWFW